MHALAHLDNQPEELLNRRLVFQFDSPWILIKSTHKRVNYEFSTLSTGFDEKDSDCIALTFCSEFSFEPGTQLSIGVPLPDAMRDYSAEVVACMNALHGYDISLMVRIESDMDLLTLMRSNACMSQGYNC